MATACLSLPRHLLQLPLAVQCKSSMTQKPSNLEILIYIAGLSPNFLRRRRQFEHKVFGQLDNQRRHLEYRQSPTNLPIIQATVVRKSCTTQKRREANARNCVGQMRKSCL
jgi:hypothetical protein